MVWLSWLISEFMRDTFLYPFMLGHKHRYKKTCLAFQIHVKDLISCLYAHEKVLLSTEPSFQPHILNLKLKHLMALLIVNPMILKSIHLAIYTSSGVF